MKMRLWKSALLWAAASIALGGHAYALTVADGRSQVVAVPENRAVAGSRTLKVHYTLYPASTDRRGAPVVYLSGAKSRTLPQDPFAPDSPAVSQLRQLGDVVVMEPRGVGASSQAAPCDSGQSLPLSQPVTREALTRLYRQALVRCETVWRQSGVDLRGYTVVEASEDLEALRLALGVDQIQIIGEGSGAQIALSYMRSHGAHVQRVVFSSPEGIDQNVKLPAHTDAFLQRVQALVRQDKAAADVYPDIVALMRRVHERLRAHPVSVEVRTASGAPGALVLGPYEVQLIAAFALGDPAGLPLILGAYRAMDAGDYTGVGQIIYDNLRGASLTLQPIPLIRDIHTGASADRRQVDFSSDKALLSDAMSFPMPALLGTLDMPDLGETFRRPVVSSTPALFITGTLDGWTYPEDHDAIMAGFRNAKALTVTNGGNQLLSSPEVVARISAFLGGSPVGDSQLLFPAPIFVPDAAQSSGAP